MGKKADKVRKELRKDSTSTLTDAPKQPNITGCSIPDPIECCLGNTVIEPTDGILMKCSNPQCPFDGQPVHIQCFIEYEEHLVKKIATMGSARGWTEQQRRANVWEKKGQSLIAKTCRCRCGHGTTRRDEIAHFEKVRQEQAAARAAEAAKRRHSKNQKHLPQLNFPLQRGPPAKDPKDKRRRQREGSQSDTDIDEAYTYQRGALASSTDYFCANSITSTAPTMADFEDSLSTCSRNEVFSEPVLLVEYVPAPKPSPNTRSYAAAIKNKNDTPLSEHPSPAFNDSGVISKEASPLLSSVAGSKTFSPTSSTASEASDETLQVTPIGPNRSHSRDLRERLSKIKARYGENKALELTPATKSNSQKSREVKEEEYINSELGDEDIPLDLILHWDPFTGRGFNLGEALRANVVFPGLF